MTSNETNVQRGFAYTSLRLAFRAMPLPMRAALAGAFFKAKRSFALKTGQVAGSYQCSVCGERAWRFDPLDPYLLETARAYGYKYTPEESETCNVENYECPLCNATDRDRLYALYLRDYFAKLSPGSQIKILDFAPSTPLQRFIKKSISRSEANISYRTADVQMEGVDDCVDITAMKNYADSSVDFFICSHVLEHVSDDRAALAELLRILKPGGRGILVVPILLTGEGIDEDPSVTDEAERWRRFGQYDHVRLYTKKGFLERVGESGFSVHQFGLNHFGDAAFKLHGITDQSVLYIVEKT